MPPRAAGTAPVAGGRLTPARYAAHALGLPLLLAAFGAGVAGFLVLADAEGTQPLSQTAFAEWWRWLIGKNAFFQPFTVNFGFIGLAYCISTLVAHHRAPAAAAAAAAAAQQPARKKRE